MKKVLFISHGLCNGGAQRVSALISNYLVNKGYDVTYISAYSNDKIYKLDEKVKNIFLETTFNNKILKYIQRTRMISKITKQEKPDTIISFIYWETLPLLFYKKAKKIYSLRNAPKFFGKVKLFFTKILFRNADCVVFQTPDAMNYFSKKIQKKGCVIENPITKDLPVWDKDNYSKRIITAARLEKQKNLKMLIDGFEIIHQKHQEYELFIYGKGSLHDELINYAKEKKLSNCIHIEDFTSHIHEYISKSAIFALTSDYEGISNSMIEALGIGIPTICTDCPVGGAKMFIKNDINGILVPINGTNELASGINKIIENKDFAESLSNNAMKIRVILSDEKIMNKWEKIIK